MHCLFFNYNAMGLKFAPWIILMKCEKGGTTTKKACCNTFFFFNYAKLYCSTRKSVAYQTVAKGRVILQCTQNCCKRLYAVTRSFLLMTHTAMLVQEALQYMLLHTATLSQQVLHKVKHTTTLVQKALQKAVFKIHTTTFLVQALQYCVFLRNKYPQQKTKKFPIIKYNPDFTDIHIFQSKQSQIFTNSIQQSPVTFNTTQTKFNTAQIHKYLSNKSTNLCKRWKSKT